MSFNAKIWHAQSKFVIEIVQRQLDAEKRPWQNSNHPSAKASNEFIEAATQALASLEHGDLRSVFATAFIAGTTFERLGCAIQLDVANRIDKGKQKQQREKKAVMERRLEAIKKHVTTAKRQGDAIRDALGELNKAGDRDATYDGLQQQWKRHQRDQKADKPAKPKSTTRKQP
jgi:predicted  nucleic acid-binding Zn-ribbon protein